MEYNKQPNKPYDDEWTTRRLKDELYLNLMNVRSADNAREYEQQARQLMYRIPVYKPTPRFVVKAKDLTDRIKQELRELHNKTLDEVMDESIGRVFESINERYFLLSVKRLLQWEII